MQRQEDSVSIWLRCVKWSGSLVMESYVEKIGSDQPDMVRWIDTSCMVADCLTKRMRSDRLSGCLRSCLLDLIPTDDSVRREGEKERRREGEKERRREGEKERRSMMLEQAGLSRFEQNMVLTYTKVQRTHDSHRRSPARTALRRTPSWA